MLEWCRLAAAFVILMLGAPGETTSTDIWELDSLRDVPLDIEVLSSEESDNFIIEEIYYTSEIINGRPIRVFGYLARPGGERKVPAVIQLHGGGGTASRQQAIWAAKTSGACVLNIDWSGIKERAEHVTLTDAMPDPKAWSVVYSRGGVVGPVHIVRAVSRGADVLRERPEVDRSRIGVTGGSWGGFLALLTAGIDSRLACAASGFGAGGFRETWSWCSRDIHDLDQSDRDAWLAVADPIHYLKNIRGPVAFMTATNEAHFPLDTAVRTFNLLPNGSRFILCPNAAHTVSAGVKWPHDDWVLFCFSMAPAWPAVKEFHFDGKTAAWKVEGGRPVESSTFYFSPGSGNWPGRVWLPVRPRLIDDVYAAELPPWLKDTAGAGYPLVIDDLQRSAAALPIHVKGRGLREMSAARETPGLIDDFETGTDLWRLFLWERQKASLHSEKTRNGAANAMVVREKNKKAVSIEVETNAIALASCNLGSEGFLVFEADSAATATELQLTLGQLPRQKAEENFTARATLAAKDGWQTISVPLAAFRNEGKTPTWELVSRFAIGWQAQPGQALRFANVRVE